MGQLVFQATAGGQVALVGPNPSTNFSLNVPAVNSTLATLAAQTFTGQQTDTVDASISGLTVGKGGGAVASNTAVGASALASNSSGANTTSVGNQAGFSQTTSSNNSYFGNQAGLANVTGAGNCYFGVSSGVAATGSNNSFYGFSAGYLVTSGAKNTILGGFSGNQGGLDIRTSSNYIVLSDGDGNPLAFTANSNTFALQGGTISAGTGIAFPATQSASSNANTLDDYEEGTFTPVINGSGGNPTVTYSFQLGTYTKIGNIVNFSIDVRWNGLSGGGGSVSIVGLPFTVNGSYGRYVASIETYTNAFTGSYLAAECVESSTQIGLVGISTIGTNTSVTVANLAVTGIAYFRITGSYRVA